MRNEKDREELSRYFGSHPKSNSSKKGGDDFFGDQTMQFFDNTQDEDDEDMKVVSDGFDDFAGYDESDANRRPKKRRGQSKLSRFAQSFVLICVFVGIAIFLAYFALTSASDLLGSSPSSRDAA